MTPPRSSRIWDIVRWNISGAELIPNGSRLKQYRPCGVMKVVNRRDSSSSGSCQNPLLASSFEKTLLLPNFSRLSLTDDIGCTSRCTDLFRWVRSTLILTVPFAFCTGTMPEHHLVGTVTGEMISCRTMDSISDLICGRRGCAIFRAVYRQTGVASAHSVMWCSVFSLPMPLKSDPNSALMFSWTLSTRATKSRPTHARRLSREFSWFWMT